MKVVLEVSTKKRGNTHDLEKELVEELYNVCHDWITQGVPPRLIFIGRPQRSSREINPLNE